MPPFFQSIQRFFRLPDLRKKFLIVLGLLVVSRLISAIPIPGTDRSQLATFFNSNTAFSLLNIFSGGGLSNFSIALMGVGPYITASIIFQLLTQAIPSLEALSKEGEFGRRRINQYTRLATIPLALIQGFSTLTFLRNAELISDWTPWNLIFMLIVATGGTMLLLWLGELISEQGIGNGLSLLITSGIIASFPGFIQNTYELYRNGIATPELIRLLVFALLALGALAVIILMNEGQRNIPVSYARRAQSGGYGNVDTHLPVKVNASGVMPIIFAVSMASFPVLLSKFLQQAASPRVREFATSIDTFFANQWYYAIIYFVLVVAFTYFYVFIVFQPKQVAENLQKQGGFIPGIRPGQDTELYLYTLIQRLTFIGAIFLGIIAILPTITQQFTKVQTLSLGGTSLLIVVSVVLEVMRQVRAQLVSRTYEAYV